jgi:hypothetical protein
VKTREEFIQFFEHSIAPELKPLEARRKAALKKIVLFTAAMIAGMMAAMAVLGAHQAPSSLVIGVLFGSLAILILGIKNLRFDVAGEFKRIAVAKLVSFISPGFIYDPVGSIPRDTFVASRLFHQKFKLYRGGDLIRGRIDGLEISCCSLLVMTGRRRGGRHEENRKVFHGLFFTIGPSEDARARVVVVPQFPRMHTGRIRDKMLGALGLGRGEQIPIDDAEFEREFAVYGEGAGEARSLLTADLRRRILDLKRRAGRDIAVSFAGEKTYVAVSYGFDLFEAYLTRSVLDQPSMETNFDALQLAAGIAGDLGRKEHS